MLYFILIYIAYYTSCLIIHYFHYPRSLVLSIILSLIIYYHLLIPLFLNHPVIIRGQLLILLGFRYMASSIPLISLAGVAIGS